MCGRFVQFTVAEELHRALEAIPGLAPVSTDARVLGPRYNIAPTMPITALALDDSGRTLSAAVRWGLVPHWARSLPSTPYFNARAESWREKPTFRDARPCVIPMNGWYEWRDGTAHFVSRGAGDPIFTVAGLWDRWGDVVSATIITTEAVGKLRELHPRMPRVLADDEVAAWLHSDGTGTIAQATADTQVGGLGLTSPELVAELHIRRADAAVGKVSNDGAYLLAQQD